MGPELPEVSPAGGIRAQSQHRACPQAYPRHCRAQQVDLCLFPFVKDEMPPEWQTAGYACTGHLALPHRGLCVWAQPQSSQLQPSAHPRSTRACTHTVWCHHPIPGWESQKSLTELGVLLYIKSK